MPRPVWSGYFCEVGARKSAITAAACGTYFYQKTGPMKNAISTLHIQNFKSIKDVTMTPRRVNIIIGEPNVGKSNILEAISLLGGMVYEQAEKFMGSFIRYEEPRQLFYDNLVTNTILIESNNDTVLLGKGFNTPYITYVLTSANFFKEQFARKRKEAGEILENSNTITNIIDEFYELVLMPHKNFVVKANPLFAEIDDKGTSWTPTDKGIYLSSGRRFSRIYIQPYFFSKSTPIGNEYSYTILHPPHGDNLIHIIQAFPNFRKEIAALFEPYGLKMQLRIAERKLEVVKNIDDFVYSYPYTSIADTLQRLIFYLAAIESNDDAVLLFEEPEAHSYPTYVARLGQHIVESRNNQFFIVTHSPYLVTEILEEMLTDDELKPELAIFAAYYEDYQTKVNQLSDEEVIAVRADGLDVFFNMRRFVPEAGE